MTKNLIERFRVARETLGLPPGAPFDAVKREYRKAVALAPPDRDPEGFRRLREAYELLEDPVAIAEQLLVHPMPYVDAPQLPDLGPPPPPHALLLELFRATVGSLPATVFAVEKAQRGQKKEPQRP